MDNNLNILEDNLKSLEKMMSCINFESIHFHNAIGCFSTFTQGSLLLFLSAITVD